MSFQYPLHQISYCADDKAEKRFFSFIAKELDRDAHTCFVFVSDKLAEEITLTIGQAFDLAYKKFLETSNKESDLKKQVLSLKQQLQSVQLENKNLKDQLAQLVSFKEDPELKHLAEQSEVCIKFSFKSVFLLRVNLLVLRLLVIALRSESNVRIFFSLFLFQINLILHVNSFILLGKNFF